MAPTTKSFWLGHARAWKSSGLCYRDYADQAGVNPRTLAWYVSRLRSEMDGKQESQRDDPLPPSFVEVLPTPRLSEPIELRVRDVSIRLPVDFDERALVRVLAILEARS
ncbi:MAG: hypothetical protein HC927_02810 [Deltaproteobacteria bacterium]|nr:hypothetical protein [Deltaproteobacteria bacterium]